MTGRSADPEIRQPAPAFVYRHVVSFEETNVMGNVYFTRHLSWQGRCREMFLQQHVPSVLDEITGDLRLITLRCGCEYFRQLHPFDTVDIEMRLANQQQHRIGLHFNYLCEGTLIARGTHEIGCMRVVAGELVPVHPPPLLLAALEPYRDASAEDALEGFGDHRHADQFWREDVHDIHR